KRFAENETRCPQVWQGLHVYYRCKTCGLSSNSCVCVFYFDPNDHAGHEFRMFKTIDTGCCDCGDPTAWKPSGFCMRHRISDEPKPSLLSDSAQKGARIAVNAVVFYLIWSLRRCFLLGKLRPEVTGVWAVGTCITWLTKLADVGSDYLRLIGEILLEQRDVA